MNKCEQPLQKKPPVDDVIRSVLSGTQEKLALDFVSFLKSLRMTPQWASHHSWAVSYKGKRVCYIKISEKASDGTWYIRPSLHYDAGLDAFCREEGLTACMLKNVHFCVACGRCAPGKNVTFFGQPFEHVCCAPIDFEFHNPAKKNWNASKNWWFMHDRGSQVCRIRRFRSGKSNVKAGTQFDTKHSSLHHE